MEKVMKKLALWHTRTFRPIMTHEELEPIMETLGFLALPVASPPGPTAWKEYVFHVLRPPTDAGGKPEIRRTRLPFPRIDGLHLLTYRAFIDAVDFYLGDDRVGDHFHVRGMPLSRVDDRVFDKVFRRMNDEEEFFVYREGTLDQATLLLFNSKSNSSSGSSNSSCAKKREHDSATRMVSLNDILPS